MFFRSRKESDDDHQFKKLDEIVGGELNPVAEGIRRALERTDLTPEDRREFEEALERINNPPPPETE